MPEPLTKALPQNGELGAVHKEKQVKMYRVRLQSQLHPPGPSGGQTFLHLPSPPYTTQVQLLTIDSMNKFNCEKAEAVETEKVLQSDKSS